MKKSKVRIIVATLLIAISTNISAFAHSGRTDSNGGHKDNKNVSGLGNYHYHHGQGPHLHPGGVCELEGGNKGTSTPAPETTGGNSGGTTAPTPKPVDTTKADMESARTSGYNKGYEDGSLGNSSSPSSSSAKYPEEYIKGYDDGYTKGTEKLNAEKKSVEELGSENGFIAGYNNEENNTSAYNAKHESTYKNAFVLAYAKGQDKRNLEIVEVKNDAKVLGKKDGYIREKKSEFEYSGKYMDEYISGYNEGYTTGEEELKIDIDMAARNAFLLAIQRLPIDETSYENPFIKERVLEVYKSGEEFRDTKLSVGSKLGSSLEDVKAHVQDIEKITLGIDNLNESSFLAIDDSNAKKVKAMSMNPKSIAITGFRNEEAQQVLKEFFTENLADKYLDDKKFVSKSDENVKVYKIKRTSREIKSLPKNLYVSMVYENDFVVKIDILDRKPKGLKAL
ncbi:MAG: YHYH domain-containing protein [Sarcina sp.]